MNLPSDEVLITRAMAWERANGELKAMLRTFRGYDGEEERYKGLLKACRKFVCEVEDNAYADTFLYDAYE